MKKQSLLLIIFCLISIGLFSQNRSIKFESGAWKEIISKAKLQNKLVFLDAYTSWCGPCKWLAKNVFTNDTIADFYNNNFICASIDMEKDEGIELAKKYHVQVYPSLIYINGDGEVMHRAAGAYPTKKFLETGLLALNPYDNFNSVNQKYKSGCLDPAFIISYLKTLSNCYLPTDSVILAYFKTQAENVLCTKQNWNIINKYVSKIDSRELKYLLDHKKDFIVISTEDSVNNKLFSAFVNSGMNIVYAKEFSEVKYTEYKDKIKKSNFSRTDEVIFLTDMDLYKKDKNWKKFGELTFENTDKYISKNVQQLNSIAWDYFENITDKKLLAKAIEWADKAISIENAAAIIDTKANLLFKLGKKAEAIKAEEEALAKAIATGEPTTEYEKTIEKFRK